MEEMDKRIMEGASVKVGLFFSIFGG